MKVVILAGGFGTRLSEETYLKPKPMLTIGSHPIIWHIMKIYSFYGFNEFIILLGYKGDMIKEYFYNYILHSSDLTVDLQSNSIEYHSNISEPWKITLLDTGSQTMTGGRILRAKEYLGDETFLLTYGDGLSNVDINELVKFHKERNKIITLTAVQPQGRFGALKIENENLVTSFDEKSDGDGLWINGGFFVCNKEVFDYIKDDNTIFEREPLSALASGNNLIAYKHNEFWQCMDTMRDKQSLNKQWSTGNAKWKVW